MNNLEARKIDVFLISEADLHNDAFMGIIQNKDHSFCHNLYFKEKVCDLQLENTSIVFVDCHQHLNFLEEINIQSPAKAFVIAMISDCKKYKQQVFELGARDYISYPIIPAELLVRLESIASLIKFEQLYSPLPPNKEAELISFNKHAALVDKTCRFLMAHLAEDYSLNQLCSLMVSNRNTLSKAFKQELGKSVFGWLREQRMEQARVLLEETDDSIQEISASVGYEDPANFSTAFRSMHGISPSQYRQLSVKQDFV